MRYVCATDAVLMEELYDLLQEMDRRYFLVQNLRWEFSLLDKERKDVITEKQARWLDRFGTSFLIPFLAFNVKDCISLIFKL